MLDFKKLFESSFRIRELGTQREFDCVQMGEAFESPCPDKVTEVLTEKVVEEKKSVYDPKSGKMVDTLEKRTEVFIGKEFVEANGDFRGGNIRGRKGDYVLFDGVGYFVVQDKDSRGVPVWEKRFLRL